MAAFSYTATDLEGTVIEGVIEAADEQAAVERLKNGGVIPIKVMAPRKSMGKKISLSRSPKGDLLTFTTELSSLLGAGLPLDRSLNILSEISEGKEMKEVVRSVLKSIREGSSYSDALQKHPRVFPRLYVNMVKAGETGGVLDVTLEKLNEFLEAAKELKEGVKSAVIYPIILAVTGGISILILLTFVIPRFSILFNELGGNLPTVSKIVLVASEFLQQFWWAIFPSVIGAAIVLRLYFRSEKGSYKWDSLKLRFLGNIVRKLETARFCRTLGTLMRSGVPFLQALMNSKDVITNKPIAEAIEKVTKNVKEGRGIAGPLADSEVFPPLAISMIKVGEETGQLDVMLLKVAATYERNLKDTVQRFMKVLEPVLILVMGLVIGFIVISMLVAIFSITDLPF